MITKERGEAVKPFLPPYLKDAQVAQLQLLIAIKETDDHGNRRSAAKWPRPPLNRTWWKLELGEVDDNGRPTGEGMTLTPRVAREDGMQQSQVLMKWDDPTAVLPVFRHHQVPLLFSADECSRWDRESGLVKPRGRIEYRWTFRGRWDAFVAYIQSLHAVSTK